MSGTDPGRLAATVARLEDTVGALERRVARLEQAAGSPPVPVAAPDPAAAQDGDRDLRPSASRGLFLLGRTILVLAGAFLLRALTEGGTLPPLAGFAAATLYALALIVLADRAAGAGDRAGAGAFGLTAALVAFPLLLESTGISSIVPATGGAVALSVLTAAGLLVAARRRLRFLAWVYSLAALATIVVLMFALDRPVLFTALLLGLGIATLLLAYTREWRLERWLPALVADAVILRLVIMAADPGRPGPDTVRPAAGTVMILALALVLLYLGIFTFRTLVQGKGARVFYVVQSTAVLLIGFGGAVRIAGSGVGGAAVLGWLALAAAIGYYTAAFIFVRERHGRGQGFFYFASLGMVLLVMGSRVVAGGSLLAWIWIVLGVGAALLGARFDRATLRGHSAVYLALAGLQTGLFAAGWDAFLGGADGTWRRIDVAALVTMAAAGACYVLLALARRGSDLNAADRLPRFCVLLTALAGAGLVAVVVLVRLVGPMPPAAAAGSVAVVRTAVLAATAVLLAGRGRRPAWRELAWPVYPLLALGCIKLLLEDLRRGTPLTLTIGFALLGAALIVAPRLLLGAKGHGATEGTTAE